MQSSSPPSGIHNSGIHDRDVWAAAAAACNNYHLNAGSGGGIGGGGVGGGGGGGGGGAGGGGGGVVGLESAGLMDAYSAANLQAMDAVEIPLASGNLCKFMQIYANLCK